jgi:hypothetical protein
MKQCGNKQSVQQVVGLKNLKLAEILLKVALNNITLTQSMIILFTIGFIFVMVSEIKYESCNYYEN